MCTTRWRSARRPGPRSWPRSRSRSGSRSRGAAAGAMYKGGTQEVDGISFTMVHAEHGSGLPDGSYGGEPVGFVIQFENGFKIYSSGDNDEFRQLAPIR